MATNFELCNKFCHSQYAHETTQFVKCDFVRRQDKEQQVSIQGRQPCELLVLSNGGIERFDIVLGYRRFRHVWINFPSNKQQDKDSNARRHDKDKSDHNSQETNLTNVDGYDQEIEVPVQIT
ncbi:hypothetical protein Ae201684_001880 [Aphanomyces euteiches]|uniref:Uncharacterized protein n=1 Tax=Aphanomyces euteiches TaxID=100861 RepID=A0A6G0XS69_9STRA|nr:hypothetical protein Ae201684_001880 [Aphanomyces euteiches]